MFGRKKEANPDKLGFGRLMLWKSSDMGAAGVQAIVLGYLSLYCSDTLGIDIATIGVLLMASKIFDGITDIFAGWLVDNTRTKLGKGRPYELCIIGVMICSLGLFAANPAWSGFLKCAWIFVMYTLVFSIFTTLRAAGGTPYTIRAFSNNQVLITKVASYGGIVTMASSMVISMAFPIVMSRLATSAAGWTAAVAIFVVPLGLISVLRFLFIKEDPSVDAGSQHKKVSVKEIFIMFSKNPYVWLYAIIMLSYNITTALGAATYYFKWVVGNTALMSVTAMFSIVLLPLMLVFPIIMRKIGSMGNMIFYFCGISVAGYLIVFFSNAWLPGVFLGGMLGALGTLPIAYYGILFIMKCCTYNEMKGLARMDASSTILANFTSKIGSAVGSVITGALLGLAGYVSGENVAAQPDSAVLMIRIVYAVVPAVCVLLIAICARAFTKLEKQIPAWEAEQEKRKAEAKAVREA